MGFRMVSLAVAAGAILRMIAESASEGSLQPAAAYGAVFRLASRCLLFGWKNDEVVGIRARR